VRANRDTITVMLGRALAAGLEPALAVVVVVDQRDEGRKDLADLSAERRPSRDPDVVELSLSVGEKLALSLDWPLNRAWVVGDPQKTLSSIVPP
jgi:hypothetical protein